MPKKLQSVIKQILKRLFFKVQIVTPKMTCLSLLCCWYKFWISPFSYILVANIVQDSTLHVFMEISTGFVDFH